MFNLLFFVVLRCLSGPVPERSEGERRHRVQVKFSAGKIKRPEK